MASSRDLTYRLQSALNRLALCLERLQIVDLDVVLLLQFGTLLLKRALSHLEADRILEVLRSYGLVVAHIPTLITSKGLKCRRLTFGVGFEGSHGVVIS